jgi:gliding motility-associated lipoprotein GldD
MIIRTASIMLFVSVMISSCTDTYIPKPKGYHRIEYPAVEYAEFSSECPFTLEYPTYGSMVLDPDPRSELCWYNLEMPIFDAKLHFSYKNISDREVFMRLTEDARTFVYKHVVKADGIKEDVIYDTTLNKFGMFYSIEGNTANNLQFFVTDSTTHFLRGALYFNAKPQIDSIQPVLDFVAKDIQHMLKTLEWK